MEINFKIVREMINQFILNVQLIFRPKLEIGFDQLITECIINNEEILL